MTKYTLNIREKLRSLSMGIILALCAGLLLPSLFGSVLLLKLRQSQIQAELDSLLDNKLHLLAIGLPKSVWNIDINSAETIIQAVMIDQQIVRITIKDTKQRDWCSQEIPERRQGQTKVAQLPLKLDSQLVGSVELEIDNSLRAKNFAQERSVYFLVLLVQVLMSLSLIVFALRRRVLHPLRQLSKFSNQIASGNLEKPLDWHQKDEIGQLAMQLETMRLSLRAAFSEQNAILNNIHVGVLFVRELKIQMANLQAEHIFACDHGQLDALSIDVLYPSKDQFISISQQAYATNGSESGVYENELQLKRFDGSTFWAQLRGTSLDPSKPQNGSIWVIEDITEQRRTSDQLRLSATVFENTADGVIITDQESRILAVNRSFERITGYRDQEVLGKTPALLNSGRHSSDFFVNMWEQLTQKHHWSGELWNRRKNGEIYPEVLTITAVVNANGAFQHFVGVFNDITYRKAAEDEIRRLAFYDPLTQLPNRRLMQDRLGQAVNSSARNHRHGALMLIDLDNFKTLNDTLGHDVGDQLLVRVAARLESCVRAGDTVARLGGDEFVVILENLDEGELAAVQATNVAQKMLLELSHPFLLDLPLGNDTLRQRSHACSASLGISLFLDQAMSVEELMKRADTAMYQAKAAGRNTLRFFDPQTQSTIAARAAMEIDLRQAIAEQQFVLYYQAQMDAADHLLGAEVLLRWIHPKKGMISPVEFIPLAEESGLILPLVSNK